MLNSSSSSLTAYLLSLRTAHSYIAATQHPFLSSAGRGVLPPSTLAFWLHQDRIYARAYPAFIGRLLVAAAQDPIPSEDIRLRRLTLLSGALANIVRELGFFESTARAAGLDIEGWKERKATRAYTAEMVRIGAGSFADGLVFLWAMERVRLRRQQHDRLCSP
jgi:thiaminase